MHTQYINKQSISFLFAFSPHYIHLLLHLVLLYADISGKLSVDFFNFFTSEVKKLIYTVRVRYAEQAHTSSEAHLSDQPKACGHEWIKNHMQRDKVDLLLAIIITMEVMGFPTLR